MIAVNCLAPFIPMLDMVKVPPYCVQTTDVTNGALLCKTLSWIMLTQKGY